MGQEESHITCGPMTYEHCDTILDEYKPLQRLGHGMFGVAILAQHHQKLVVLKITQYRQSSQEGQLACLANQIPGFIQIHRAYICHHVPLSWKSWLDKFYHEHVVWLILDMEVARGSLYELVQDVEHHRAFIDWPDLTSLLIQIVLALWVAWHKHGFCYGDIKLENILYTYDPLPASYETEHFTLHITSPYKIRIADFGMAQQLDPEKEDCSDVLGVIQFLYLFQRIVEPDQRQQLRELQHYLDDNDLEKAITMDMFVPMLTIKE